MPTLLNLTVHYETLVSNRYIVFKLAPALQSGNNSFNTTHVADMSCHKRRFNEKLLLTLCSGDVEFIYQIHIRVVLHTSNGHVLTGNWSDAHTTSFQCRTIEGK